MTDNLQFERSVDDPGPVTEDRVTGLVREVDRLQRRLQEALKFVERGGQLAAYHRPGTGEFDRFRQQASDIRFALGQTGGGPAFIKTESQEVTEARYKELRERLEDDTALTRQVVRWRAVCDRMASFLHRLSADGVVDWHLNEIEELLAAHKEATDAEGG